MATMTAREAQRNFGEIEQQARKGPVEITRHGRRHLVVMTAEAYDWMQAVKKRSFRTEEAPEFVIEAVRKAKMHPRHNHLNKLLKKT
jgi:prevent-host-death family protein